MAMRMSSLFLRTLREDPADAEVPSHTLLVRAGYVRRVAPGVFTWLPLGWRVFRKVEQIVGLMEIGRQEGMHTIDDTLETLLHQRLITREEVLYHCRDANRFPGPPAPVKKSIWT